jgi:hypothetical protein
MAAAWMILGGYVVLPQLSRAVLRANDITNQIPTAPRPVRKRSRAQIQSGGTGCICRRAPHGRILVHCAAMLRLPQ